MKDQGLRCMIFFFLGVFNHHPKMGVKMMGINRLCSEVFSGQIFFQQTSEDSDSWQLWWFSNLGF